MNCYNTGTITGTKSDTGGIVGNANYSYVTNMYNTGTVIGVDYVGGIAGKGSTNGINNSYNTGDIKASGNYVGGVVGITGNSGASKVSNCYNTGSVTPSETSTNVGVVAGAGNIENCYYINTFTNYTDNQGEAFTQEDFENGNLAKKLNDNLSLGYKIWGVKDKTTTFTDNSIQKSFDVYNQSNNNKIKDYT
ncbi:MAG: GLUG motif-containing protein, partial [Intestinibacter bartlettii]